MKLTIFGAAGRTGILLVQQALDADHDVVALVRTPSKLSIKNERLTVVQGDVANLSDVEKVVEGADAVLSVLGRGQKKGKQCEEDGAAGHVRDQVAWNLVRSEGLRARNCPGPFPLAV